MLEAQARSQHLADPSGKANQAVYGGSDFSDSAVSPRKIAVPVLVKDGKPCGDNSPLGDAVTPDSTSAQSGDLDGAAEPQNNSAEGNNNTAANNSALAGAGSATMFGGTAAGYGTMPASGASAFNSASAFNQTFGGSFQQFAAASYGGQHPAYYAMRTW